MNISIIINESQRKTLIRESNGEWMSNVIKNNYELVKDIVKKTSSQMGINLEFLMTWGAGIGGFVGPLNDFLSDRHPELSDVEISLILIGVITSYYVDNKELVNKIVKRIKEDGLYKPFKETLSKGSELRRAFYDFVESLGITLHKVTNILSYTFILPILPMLYNLAQEDISVSSIRDIIERLIGFGSLSISGIILKELVIKIVKRFRG